MQVLAAANLESQGSQSKSFVQCHACGSPLTVPVHLCPSCGAILTMAEREILVRHRAWDDSSSDSQEGITSPPALVIPWADYEHYYLTRPRWLSWPIGCGLRVIDFYQHRLSKRLGRQCVFEPTCSRYAQLAMMRYGLIRGSIKTIKRLWRCRPENRGIDLP